MGAKIIIVYYSRTGNTRQMAELVDEGAGKVKEVEIVVKDVKEMVADELMEYDGIVLGSPVYYGQMASDLKKLLDDSVRFHGKLEGRVGGAFASSANIGGGNETTIMSILQALLIHGMIIPGIVHGDHYGPVSIDSPDSRVEKQCRSHGERIARLVLRLKG